MKCPICKEDARSLQINNAWPFCSMKCKNIDLYGWLSGEYTYFDEEPPVEFVDEEEEETWRN